MTISTPPCRRGTVALREMLGVDHSSPERSGQPRLMMAAGMAASADLGFAAGAQASGSYVTVLSRSAACVWQVMQDMSISHPAAAQIGPTLSVTQAEWTEAPPPPERLMVGDVAGRAMGDFGRVVEEEGLAPALRTYGRNVDFALYLEGQAPFAGVDAANTYLERHAIAGALQVGTGARSADGGLLYSVGEFSRPHAQVASCFQLWQYDPKVSNWGVRILLLGGRSASRSAQ